MDFIVDNIAAKENYAKLLEEFDVLATIDENVSWKFLNDIIHANKIWDEDIRMVGVTSVFVRN